ncbi:Rab family GTPase [Legionella lytica]|uniref:Rab family GTPase n=1 Tax=Legionella lytica TaxID=96232 RepID=A0ABW8D6K8_9GAMM
MQQKQEQHRFFKLLLLGDRAVGKTTLVQKFVKELDPDCYYATCGVDQKICPIVLFNQPIDLRIWDAGGDLKLWPLVKRYLPETHGALVCFDVTNPFSLTRVNNYVESLREVQPNLPIMLIACKTDLAQKRMVTQEQVQQVAQKLEIASLETSGLKKKNVNEAFMQITQRMFFARMLNQVSPTLERYFNDYANNPPNPISKKEIALKEEYKLLLGQLLRATSLDELIDFHQKTSNLIDKANALFARKHPIWNTLTLSPLSSVLKKTLTAVDSLQKNLLAELESEPPTEAFLSM